MKKTKWLLVLFVMTSLTFTPYTVQGAAAAVPAADIPATAESAVPESFLFEDAEAGFSLRLPLSAETVYTVNESPDSGIGRKSFEVYRNGALLCEISRDLGTYPDDRPPYGCRRILANANRFCYFIESENDLPDETLKLIADGFSVTEIKSEEEPIVYTNEDAGFSVAFPASWKDQYTLEETWDGLEFSVSLYHTATVEEGKYGGYLGVIGRRVGYYTDEWPPVAAGWCPILAYKNGFTYYFSGPSDLQYNINEETFEPASDAAKTYKVLENQIDNVLHSFTAFDPWISLDKFTGLTGLTLRWQNGKVVGAAGDNALCDVFTGYDSVFDGMDMQNNLATQVLAMIKKPDGYYEAYRFVIDEKQRLFKAVALQTTVWESE